MIAIPETLAVESKPRLETAGTQWTLAVEPKRSDSSEQNAADERLYLIGRPTLKAFIRYVRGHAVNPPGEGSLTEEWQAASHIVRALEKEEAGLADNPPIGKIELEKYEPLLVEFLKDPLVRYGFNRVPTEVAMVDLDRLVVYQKHIDLTYVRQLESRLGPAPSEEQIFRTCLPYDHPQPPVKWSRVHGDRYVFMSPSNDLRFLGTMRLKSKNIRDYPPPGNLVGVVGIAIGFGSNFLNAVYAEKRLILNNGSHRAYTLRKMGFTHVPCIVQHISSREELDFVACSDIRSAPDLFLKHPRPSMLRDYFNPSLYKVMRSHRRLHQITVRFKVEDNFVPAL